MAVDLAQPTLRLGLEDAPSVRDAVFALSAWARDEKAVAAAIKKAPKSVRGALEHFYRATERPMIDIRSFLRCRSNMAPPPVIGPLRAAFQAIALEG